MKKYMKRIAVGVLTGALAAGGLTGCGEKAIDGAAVVATVNDEQIPMGVLSYTTRYQQAQTTLMYNSYFGGMPEGFWEEAAADDESGQTYGEATRQDVLDQLELEYILRQKAEEYDVTLTEEDSAAIEEAAKAFIESNDAATLAKMGVSQEHVATALELSTYQYRMREAIVEDVDQNVSDEEATQSGVTFVKVEKESEDKEADPKTNAQSILEQVMATANADMDAIAKSVDEELNAVATHYNTYMEEDEETATTPQEVIDAVKGLSDGEVAGSLIETEDAYYVARLDKKIDEDATEDERVVILNDRKQDKYTEVTEGWADEAKVEVDDKVLETLEIKSNEVYSLKMPETPAEEVPADETTVGEETTTEAPADETTETE